MIPTITGMRHIDGAYPALHRLREQGVVRAIGAAMDQAEMLVRFAHGGDFDALPGRLEGTPS